MIRRLKADPTDWYETNKLAYSAVAASAPELAQAEERIAGPLERSEAEVNAAVEHHRHSTLWAPMVNAALGLWLITSPLLIGLFDPVTARVPPALGHELADASVRNTWLGISEIISGFAVAALVGRNSEIADRQVDDSMIADGLCDAADISTPLSLNTSMHEAYHSGCCNGGFRS